MSGALKAFERMNGGTKPTKVIVYRDGVSEGQTQALLEGEVSQIKSALLPDCRLVYVVVNKRVDAKFFSVKGGNFDGCQEGVCVDSTVTKKGAYDY